MITCAEVELVTEDELAAATLELELLELDGAMLELLEITELLELERLELETIELEAIELLEGADELLELEATELDAKELDLAELDATELDAIELASEELELLAGTDELLELEAGALELESEELLLELDAGALLLAIDELLGAELLAGVELELFGVPPLDETELLERLLETGAIELLELAAITLEMLELDTTELARLLLDAGELLAGLDELLVAGDELLVATDELLDTVGVGDDSPPLPPPQAVSTRLNVRDETSVRLRMATPLLLWCSCSSQLHHEISLLVYMSKSKKCKELFTRHKLARKSFYA